MIGFLRKDLYMFYAAYKKNLLLVFLLYAAMVVFMKNIFLMSVLIWLMPFYSLSAITMDDSCGWDRFARTLPVSSGAIITARALAVLVMLGIGVGFALVLTAILYFFMDYNEIGELMGMIALVTALALASIGVLIPAAYKWGVERVRNSFVLLFMLVFLTPVLLGKTLGTDFTESLESWLSSLSLAEISGAALGVGLLVFAFGGWLSSRIYAKKEF